MEAFDTQAEVMVVVALATPREPSKNEEAYKASVAYLQQGVLDRLDDASFVILHRFSIVPGLALRVNSRDVVAALASFPEVLKIDLEVGGGAALNESRPWIRATQAHTAGWTGLGRIAAVLDTGIDTDHPDLINHLTREHCICNTGTDCCPQGGGSGDGPGSAEDDNGHGTHVVGIITSDGIVAPQGIAPGAGVVAVKVLDAAARFQNSSDIVAALVWIYNNAPEVDVVNMSLGTWAEFDGDCDEATAWTINWAAAVTALRSKGVLCVAASMNSGHSSSMGVPACLSGVISVGATFDDSDTVAGFSNSSTSLDLLAPGAPITSTWIGGGSHLLWGTSMATPHVAAVALMLRQQAPAQNVEDLVSCLKTSPYQVADGRNGLTFPRVDATAALSACIVIDPPKVLSMRKLTDPFRIAVVGENLQEGIQVYINGVLWNNVKWKGDSKVVLKGGGSLKAKVPKGAETEFKLVNPDSGETTLSWQWF
jgi:subtilisin family serine protease